METKVKTTQELKAVIDYIMWSYDHNTSSIADKKPTVNIEEKSNLFIVTITYIADIKSYPNAGDPVTQKENETICEKGIFSLLKTESFYRLTKYVEDICEEMAKVEIDY